MSAAAERALVVGRHLAVERVLAAVRTVGERSGFVVLDELLIPHSARGEFDVRVEFATPAHPRVEDPRVEVLRVRSDDPDTGWVHTVSPFAGVTLTDPTHDLTQDVPWPPSSREVPSNADYRRLVEHRLLGEDLSDDVRRSLDGVARNAFDVARERSEAPVELVRLALRLLDDVASGVPAEWAARRLAASARE